MKKLAKSFGYLLIYGAKIFWIGAPIASLLWLIKSINEKASPKQYFGVFLLFVIGEIIGTLVYFRGKGLIEKEKKN